MLWGREDVQCAAQWIVDHDAVTCAEPVLYCTVLYRPKKSEGGAQEWKAQDDEGGRQNDYKQL
jgi:hypothetical protein